MSDSENLSNKLEEVIEAIESLLILEGLKAKIPPGDVRILAGVGMDRVTRVSKMLKRGQKKKG